MNFAMKSVLIVWTLCMTIFTVVAAHAQQASVYVDGEVVEVYSKPNMIVVDDILSGNQAEVYGIRYPYLEKYNIVLEEGINVYIEAFEYECKDGSINLMAESVKVGNVTVDLR